MKADRGTVEKLIKTARGQLEGILRMIEQDRYCMDISNQIMATQAILHRVNREILQAHLQHCVRQSLETGEDSQQKIDELMALFDKAVF